MKKVISFFCTYGLYFMIIGFIVATTGLLVLMRFRYVGGIGKQAGIYAAAAGLAIYVAGRIGVVCNRRRSSRPDQQESCSNDGEDA